MNENRKLAKLIEEAFSLEELRLLCIDLDINYDDIRGETVSTKARELIRYLKRRGGTDSLLQLIKEERPHLADRINETFSLPTQMVDSISVVESDNNKPRPLHYYWRAEQARFVLPTSMDIFLRWLRVRAASAAGIGVIPSLKFYHHYHLDSELEDSLGGSKALAIRRYTMADYNWVLLPVVAINLIELRRGESCEVWVARLSPESINYHLMTKAELGLDWYKSDYDALLSDILVRWSDLTRIES